MKSQPQVSHGNKPAGAPRAPRDTPAAFWDRASAALARFALPLALCFIAIGCVRIVSTYRELSVTVDEPWHFACGLEYLDKHAYRCETQHPPLERVATALLPYWDGARYEASLLPRPLMRQILQQSGDPWRVIARMRAGVLPFFVLAALAVFWGARRHFGAAVAVVSTALFTLIPPVLAHSGLATTDIALTATLPAAFFALVWWCESPGWLPAVICGLFTGLMVFSKFSSLAYFPAAGALATASHLAIARPARKDWFRLIRERAPTFALAVGVGALVIWAGYFFSFGPVPAWHSSIKVPAPELFDGIQAVADHNAAGHSAYLLGEHRATGWWYYFPVAVTYKTPIALLILAAVGLVASWSLRRRGGLLPVSLCLGILIPAMFGHINIGVRHVLPIYSGIAVLGGLGFVRLAEWMRGTGWMAAVVPALLVAWMAGSGARSHPDYLGYFNEFAGDQPEAVLLDSDLDWQQGLVLLGRRLHQVGVTKLWFDYRFRDFATKDILEDLYGLPEIQPETTSPQPGWHAESMNEFYQLQDAGTFKAANPNLTGVLAGLRGPWYQRLRPIDRVGGNLIYRIPDDFVP